MGVLIPIPSFGVPTDRNCPCLCLCFDAPYFAARVACKGVLLLMCDMYEDLSARVSFNLFMM